MLIEHSPQVTGDSARPTQEANRKAAPSDCGPDLDEMEQVVRNSAQIDSAVYDGALMMPGQ